MTTQSSDFVFAPKVWQDHVDAFFRQKLVYGAFAFEPSDKLNNDAGSGLTINFPYFSKIGDAEEPAENESLIPDTLSDDSFQATVFEVAKAVGIKKKAWKKSAAGRDRIMSEAQRQIARVHAEKLDNKLNTEIHGVGNYRQGFLATANTDKMNVKRMLQAKIVAFGDLHNEALVCFMHSFQFYDMMADDGTGFLKADANDPFVGINGFQGRILGMGIVTVDSTPKLAQIAGKDAYRATFHKVGSYGWIKKQEMEMDSDYDILAREWVVTGNEWYAVKSFHAKIAADDYKAGAITTVTDLA